jgi:mono/diheme cytochrome c family protein
MQNWYAPPLTSAAGAGVADWETAHVVSLLRSGVSPRGTAMGPMAEVVYQSTQHLSEADLLAIAGFLKSLPQVPDARAPTPAAADPRVMAAGARLYADHCETCHGRDGEGAYPAYPALAGNRSVTADPPANAIKAVVSGGYAPATSGNPRPYGMPPFVYALKEDEIAAVLTYVRASWGNRAGPLTSFDVQRYR